MSGKEGFLAELAASLQQHVSLRVRERRHYEIAVLTSLTGKWAKGGWITKRGYDLWAERVNEQGGLQAGNTRYPVRLIYYDTRSDPEYARRLTEELLAAEQIDFIFGPYSSDETLAIAPAIERAEVPQITGSAESEEILKRGFEWTFGILLTGSNTLRAPLKLLRDKLAPELQTAALISADDVFSRSTARAFLAAAEELRFRLSYREVYPAGLQEFVPLVQRVRRFDPDVLIVSGHIDNLISFTQATKLLNYSPRAYVMHYGVASQDFLNALGPDAKHILGVSQWSPQANYRGPVFGSSHDFHEAFVERYGRQPDHTEAGCAATGVVFQQLIERTGLHPPLTERDKRLLRDLLWEAEFQTFFGPISFARQTGPRERG